MTVASVTPPARPGTPLRWIPAALGAVLVTAALFLLMTWLIAEDIVRIEEPSATEPIRISFDPDPYTPPPDRTPPDRVDVEPPPPAPTLSNDSGEVAPGPSFELAPPRVEPDIELIGSDGLALAPPPVEIRVPPAYPAREQGRGIEGDCTVRYDVTAAGQAVNIDVVSCDSSGFARATVEAVSQWRFAVSGGRRSGEIVARGQTTTLQYRLD